MRKVFGVRFSGLEHRSELGLEYSYSSYLSLKKQYKYCISNTYLRPDKEKSYKQIMQNFKFQNRLTIYITIHIHYLPTVIIEVLFQIKYEALFHPFVNGIIEIVVFM